MCEQEERLQLLSVLSQTWRWHPCWLQYMRLLMASLLVKWGCGYCCGVMVAPRPGGTLGPLVTHRSCPSVEQWASSIPAAPDAAVRRALKIVPPPPLLGQTKLFIKGTASVHQGQSRPPYDPTARQSFEGIERVNAGEGHVMLSLDGTGRTFVKLGRGKSR